MEPQKVAVRENVLIRQNVLVDAMSLWDFHFVAAQGASIAFIIYRANIAIKETN